MGSSRMRIYWLCCPLKQPIKHQKSWVRISWFHRLRVLSAVSPGHGPEALQGAREVRRSADEKPHSDLPLSAAHVHQHQRDPGLLPRGGGGRLETSFEFFISHGTTKQWDSVGSQAGFLRFLSSVVPAWKSPSWPTRHSRATTLDVCSENKSRLWTTAIYTGTEYQMPVCL